MFNNILTSVGNLILSVFDLYSVFIKWVASLNHMQYVGFLTIFSLVVFFIWIVFINNILLSLVFWFAYFYNMLVMTDARDIEQ